MSRRERLIRSMVVDIGLICHAITQRGSGHYMAEVERGNGGKNNFFFSKSPSDHRGDLNKVALVKRWARAVA